MQRTMPQMTSAEKNMGRKTEMLDFDIVNMASEFADAVNPATRLGVCSSIQTLSSFALYLFLLVC